MTVQKVGKGQKEEGNFMKNVPINATCRKKMNTQEGWRALCLKFKRETTWSRKDIIDQIAEESKFNK